MNLHTKSGTMFRNSISHWMPATRVRGVLSWLLIGLGTEALPSRAAENPNQPGLMAYWKFAPDRQMGDDVKPVAGGMDVTFVGPVRFTKDPGPLTAPESVTTLSIFMFVVLLSNAPPAKFKSPLKSASPNATVPDKISPFATVRPVTESLVIRPVPIVTLPVPKPLL